MSKEEVDRTWQALSKRQLARTPGKMSRIFFEGLQKLDMSVDHVPDFEQVDLKLKSLTGWGVAMTDVEFSSGDHWWSFAADKNIMINEGLREFKDLDFVIFPDTFHDAFGHLPFVAVQHYADIFHEMMLLYIEQRDPEIRRQISHVWWYTGEFGLIREEGEVKGLGTGLASSSDELENAFSGRVPIQTFQLDKVLATPAHEGGLHQTYFVIDQLEDMLEAVKEIVERHSGSFTGISK